MRSYFNDSYKCKFTARVLREEAQEDGRYGVVLDETFFYPTSGGQPNDVGTIAGVKVLDVVDGEEIVHVLEHSLREGQGSQAVQGTESLFNIQGQEVDCELDWGRRFDHMQQHAGQHILSACFQKLYDAETVGFHLGDEYVTVDVTLEDLDWEMVRKVETAANEIIYRNLPIKAYFIQPDQVDTLPLRKKPVVTEDIRIIEVEGEDYSPCGGTHPARTGEIGIIKVRRWEKKRNNTRVEFICGRRAFQDYQWKTEQINDISNALSVKDNESLEGFNRLFQEAKDLRRDMGFVQSRLLSYEAQEFYDKAEVIKGVHLVSAIFTDRDLNSIRRLATQICDRDKAIALFAAKGEKAQIIFQRSENVNINMSDLLKEVMPLINGSGGGNPKSAQGGGTDLHNLESLMQSAQLIISHRHLK